jgi:hypothetical protein
MRKGVKQQTIKGGVKGYRGNEIASNLKMLCVFERTIGLASHTL